MRKISGVIVAILCIGIPVTRVSAADSVLVITKISAVKTFAIADGTFTNGWKLVFDMTVPTNESVLQLKFADWTDGTSTLTAGGNMQFYAAQALNAPDENHALAIGYTSTYSGAMLLDPNKDLDSSQDGRQIEVIVEMRVPEGSSGGSYSTLYGVQSNQDTVAPAIPIITTSAKAVNTNAIHIAGTAEAGAVITIADGADIATSTADVDGNYDIAVTLNQNAVNDLSVTSTDAWGNVSSPATVTIIHDNIRPVITVTTSASLTIPTDQDITIYASANEGSLNMTSCTLSGNAICRFSAIDSAGNRVVKEVEVTNITKTILVMPVMALNGGTVINVGVGDYRDLGVSLNEPATVSATYFNKYIAGTYTVTYTAIDTAGNQAVPITRTVNVLKCNQTIDFGPLDDKQYGDPDFAVYSIPSSRLDTNFTATGDCTVDGGIEIANVHMTGVGSCTITVHQAGNYIYNAAPDVSQTFNIL